MIRGIAGCLMTLLLLSGSGCESLAPKEPVGKGAALLPQRDLPPETVGIEIYLIRIAPQQQALLRRLWLEVDEQTVAPERRLELRNQGLRLGVQGSVLSPTLSQLINVTASRPGSGSAEAMNEVAIADIQRDPDVTRQYRNLLPGMRAMLRPFDDTIDEMSLFWSENGRLCGKTYKDAQGLIGLSAKPQSNGTVRFDIVPELEYGSAETKFRVQSAIVFHENAKPRRVFESLAVSLDLLPGQWIIMGPTSTDCSGIGAGFFIRGTERQEQRIIVVRLVRLKKDRPGSEMNRPSVDHVEDISIPERN